ncbi:MAG: penicillin-binding transpeptidase domain-containing protein [Caulobacteraceae bacterium]|nr:penicillin-binding transpeptidase domain-containing protein [Caulobacteraceae bacterium]
MTRGSHRLRHGLLALSLVLAACGPVGGKAGKAAAPAINADRLNADIDQRLGGLGTCIILNDTRSGHELYRYGQPQACLAKLPPCATFDIANSLIGLDLGVVSPSTVVKWDGSPQPVTAWQTDADLPKAFKGAIGWWFQKLAAGVGRDRYQAQLRALGYGDRNPGGPLMGFWQGPQAGGALTVTVEQQARFIRRFYSGDLPLKPATLAVVQSLTLDETRPDPKGAPKAGQAVISGRAASCPSVSDGSRNVGWWVGRVKTASGGDLTFAASVEGTDAPPGLEIERRLKDIFVGAGLLPAGG